MQIEFRYSDIFDEQMKQWWLSKGNKIKEYPSAQKTKALLAPKARLWKKHQRRIVTAIERVTGCHFREQRLVCYVIGRGVPISDPLVLPVFVRRPSTRFVDSLTHELLHRIFSQPNGQVFLRRVTRRLRQQYPHETWNVILHVVIHAVLMKLYQELFSVKRIQSDYDFVASLPEYKRAWDIVFALTPERIFR